MALRDTLAKLSAQQAAADEYERSKPKLIEDLQRHFETLATMVTEGLDEFIKSGHLGLSRRETSVEKPGLGVFQVKALTIRVIDREIKLTPLSGDFISAYAVAEFHLQESHNKAEVWLMKDQKSASAFQWYEKTGSSGHAGRGADANRLPLTPLTGRSIEDIVDRLLQ